MRLSQHICSGDILSIHWYQGTSKVLIHVAHTDGCSFFCLAICGTLLENGLFQGRPRWSSHAVSLLLYSSLQHSPEIIILSAGICTNPSGLRRLLHTAHVLPHTCMSLHILQLLYTVCYVVTQHQMCFGPAGLHDTRCKCVIHCIMSQDCWNRPISSAPDAWIDVMERSAPRGQA